MALNFHELYVLLEFWGGGEDGEEKGEVTLVLLKAGVSHEFFALVIVRKLGKTKEKRKKINRKSFFAHTVGI